MPSAAACLFFVILIIAMAIAVIVGGIVFITGMVLGRNALGKERTFPLSCIATMLVIPIVCIVVFWAWSSTIELGPPSPRQQPKVEDLIGEWRLSKASLQFVHEQGYTRSTSSLILREDYTFTMIDMPHIVTYIDKRGEYTSDSGTWRFQKDINGEWDILVHFNEPKYVAEKSTTTSTYFNILGKEPPYSLYKYYSDPDEGLIITLERQ